MKKLKEFIKNLSFRKKIAYISLSISLIPVLLLGSFAHIQTRHLLIERDEIALEEALDQEIRNLDYKMNSYLAAMNLIIWNENMRSSLSRTYDNNFDMYLTYRDVIDPLFLTIRSLHNTVDSITIYTDNTIHPHGDILQSLTYITETSWYDTALNGTTPFFTLSPNGKSLYLICQMYNKHSPFTNIIRMSIDASALFHSMDNLFDESYGIILLDQNNEVIYHYANFPDKGYDDSAIIQMLKSKATQNPKIDDYVVKQASLSSTSWNAYLYRPVKTVSASADKIVVIVLFIVLICLVIVLISCIILSKVVVRPLEALSENIQLINEGNLSITVSYNSSDEIGSLIHAFRKMVERLKHLIDEVLKSKITRQEYEIKALQAQINPHFLYNSLSLINGKAIISGQEDISQMAQLLSTFYRTTLNKGRNFTTVKDELQNTLSYVKIQKIMHSNSFDIVYDIDETTYSYTIPNLLLQPLVENAIIHGIDHKETPDMGVLTISCHKKGDLLVFKVLDNGSGMTEEQCCNILTSNSTGYGIRNVHHRVQLYYGKEYGLCYTSTKGLGTCVALTIPIKFNGE
ncbi:sensor histidine kinase [Anaerocolumna aminovalerica]|uniref:sensor histidine kinase n=1 Tax=Anaerocolumna aminovalerica TaxID=1527 RepID=UPI00248BD40C|nr:sensor histidine kinase [Anaerocolumna aminovalerica]